MTKITLELIESSIQRTNPLKDRELDLKGNKISLIENLGTTLDQFDALDFTDNEIHRFDGFPCLKRLKSVNFTNNKIIKIARELDQFIPNITTLVFINNNIQEIREIDNLACFKRLEFVSFLKNPVANLPNYRLCVIARLPQVRILDFTRVRDAERRQAAVLRGERPVGAERGGQVASGALGGIRRLAGDQHESVSSLSSMMHQQHAPAPLHIKPTIADIQALKAAIQNASSVEEVDRLNFLLHSGKFAGFADAQQRAFRG